jgi:hypothetical protein
MPPRLPVPRSCAGGREWSGGMSPPIFRLPRDLGPGDRRNEGAHARPARRGHRRAGGAAGSAASSAPASGSPTSTHRTGSRSATPAARSRWTAATPSSRIRTARSSHFASPCTRPARPGWSFRCCGHDRPSGEGQHRPCPARWQSPPHPQLRAGPVPRERALDRRFRRGPLWLAGRSACPPRPLAGHRRSCRCGQGRLGP